MQGQRAGRGLGRPRAGQPPGSAGRQRALCAGQTAASGPACGAGAPAFVALAQLHFVTLTQALCPEEAGEALYSESPDPPAPSWMPSSCITLPVTLSQQLPWPPLPIPAGWFSSLSSSLIGNGTLDSEHQEPLLQGGAVVQTWIRAGTLQGHPQGPRRAGAIWGCLYSLGLLSSGRERSSLFLFSAERKTWKYQVTASLVTVRGLVLLSPAGPRLPQLPEAQRRTVGAAAGNKGGIGPLGPARPAARTGGTFQSPALLSLPGRSCPPAEPLLSFCPASPASVPEPGPADPTVSCVGCRLCATFVPPEGL